MHSMNISLLKLNLGIVKETFFIMSNVECDVFQMYTEACHVPIPGCVSLDFHLLPLFTETFSWKFMVQLYYCVLTCLWSSVDLCSHSFRVNLSLLVSRCLNLTSAKVLYDALFLCSPSFHLHISIIRWLSLCFFSLYYSPVGREVDFQAYLFWKESISLFTVDLVQEGLDSKY